MASGLPAGYRRHAFDELPSTNVEALAAARRGEAGALWVTAAVQTAGKGRRGRAWSTERGNLAASLLLIDPAPPALAPTLSFVAAVALHRAILDAGSDGLVPPAFHGGGTSSLEKRLALKWPNDLLLDGRKVSGILVEGENQPGGRIAVVVGIGVNCASHPDLAGLSPATSFAAAGVAIDAEGLFVALALRMAEAIAVWNRGAGFAATRAAWLERAVGIGQSIRVNLSDRSVGGRFEALDETGRLVLARADGGRETFSTGEVFL
jgi:BirA family biotin operon repressor/biotin-[acetyl-CoA-carboxylase] ligase